KVFTLELGQDEVIDRIPRPTFPPNRGPIGTFRRSIGPMRFPVGALIDPAANEVDLRFSEDETGAGRRHAIRFVGRADALVEPAPGAVRWRDDAIAALLGVEAETSLALLLVGAVAGEALVGQDGADLTVEIDLRRGECGG